MICTRCRGNKGYCGCKIKAGDTMYLLQPLKVPDAYLENYLLPYLKKEGKINMVLTVKEVSEGSCTQVKFKETYNTNAHYWYYIENFEWI